MVLRQCQVVVWIFHMFENDVMYTMNYWSGYPVLEQWVMRSFGGIEMVLRQCQADVWIFHQAFLVW